MTRYRQSGGLAGSSVQAPESSNDAALQVETWLLEGVLTSLSLEVSDKQWLSQRTTTNQSVRYSESAAVLRSVTPIHEAGNFNNLRAAPSACTLRSLTARCICNKTPRRLTPPNPPHTVSPVQPIPDLRLITRDHAITPRSLSIASTSNRQPKPLCACLASAHPADRPTCATAPHLGTARPDSGSEARRVCGHGQSAAAPRRVSRAFVGRAATGGPKILMGVGYLGEIRNIKGAVCVGCRCVGAQGCGSGGCRCMVRAVFPVFFFTSRAV